MDIIEKYFGDGSQSSMEARVYLEDYMERVRGFFIDQLVASYDARGKLIERMRSLNYDAALINKKMFRYDRRRSLFVGRAIYNKSYAEMARRFGISGERVRDIINQETSRLERHLVRDKFAKRLTTQSVMDIFALAFSDKEDWSDWVMVRKRDFIYV
tara:strand:- start:292 stop:762 length:471 start_codon:yes stop_codon:yes gene_type:complete